MPRYAVSYISFYDNDLTTVIVNAEDWHSALLLHPKLIEINDPEYFPNTTLERCKQLAFDGDCMVEVVEIP